MKQQALILLICLIMFFVIACGDDDDDDTGDEATNDDDTANDDDATDDDSTDDDDDSGPPRSFYMAAAPFQFELAEFSAKTVFDFEGFEGNVDLVSLHTDGFFGLPWDAFAKKAEPPAAWVAEMEKIRNAVDDLGVDIYLSLTPLGGVRDTIAAKATEVDDELVIEENWWPGCYNFDTDEDADDIRAAYLNYTRWMVDFFEPIYLTHVIEMNIYLNTCPEDYDSVIDLANAVYDQEKAENPDLPIFPTFTVQDMWSYGEFGECEIGDDTCLKKSLAEQDTVLRDRMGLSSYPVFMQWEWEELQEDFYTAFAELTGEQVVFGEIGWNTHDVVSPFPDYEDDCMKIFSSSDEDQIAFMEWLFESMNTIDSDLVVWWSLVDYLPESVLEGCPCDAPGLWCIIYEIFAESDLHVAWLHWGSMGVLDYDGYTKPGYTTWNQWLSRQRE